jgi:deoxyribonuclease V
MKSNQAGMLDHSHLGPFRRHVARDIVSRDPRISNLPARMITTETIAQDPCPLVIVDVDYRSSGAIAAAIVAKTWDADVGIETRVVQIAEVKPYRPGAFFERELPCILQVLALVQSEYLAVVIDGYVDLDEHGTSGLGGHLHAHLQKNVVVVGVAKTAFHGSSFALPVVRGKSKKPLFVTARGIKYEYAATLVGRMHGNHRLPTLIKEVDTLARRT